MTNAREYPCPDNAYHARRWIGDLDAELAHRQIVFRDAPEEPTSCCGRGCSECVWDGYFEAVGYWCQQARELLSR